MDLHAPGIDARGAAMPGGPGNILIGRNQDSAWSLTSAGSDTNDLFVETLCGGSDTKYLYKGKCRAMRASTSGASRARARSVYQPRSTGPCSATRRSGGQRVAVTFDRSSRGKDVLWQILFSRLSQGKVKDLDDVLRAAATSPFTFNVAYADDKDIATYSAGLLPIRDPRVDPRLPTKGTGEYEWKGFLSAATHPHQANPADGDARQLEQQARARLRRRSDSEWSYGSLQRVQMLKAGLDSRRTARPRVGHLGHEQGRHAGLPRGGHHLAGDQGDPRRAVPRPTRATPRWSR